MNLTVVLGTHETECFDITLYDNAFVNKWVDELKWSLEHCDFNHQEAFAGLQTLADAEQVLNDACVIINKYLKNFIEIRSDIVNQPQEYFNYLHSKFEKLSGEFGNPTRLFSLANSELKTAIRNLNFYVHRLETKLEVGRSFYISFNKDQYRRKPLAKEDYENFEFNFPAGTLYVHYVELGKDLIDLFEDNLPLNYAGAKNLHFYSGEASFMFSDYDPFSIDGYKQWLIDSGVDPLDKSLGHGRIPLGTVNNLEDAKAIISRHKHIKQILIKD
jgi:hypothetical protein